MRRLNGEDSGLLSIDLPYQPLTSQFLVLLGKPSAGTAPITVEYLTEHVAKRLGEIPAFRWKLIPIPLGLDHPVVIEDPDFDISNHIRKVTVPAPGGQKELSQVVDHYNSLRLDRSRPLWELILLDGLEGGRQALITRFHHGLMDGAPTFLLLSRLLSGEDHVPVRPAEPWIPEAIPSAGKLVEQAASRHVRNLTRLPALGFQSLRHIKAKRQYVAASEAPIPKASDTPRCHLNSHFSAERRHSYVNVPLADIKVVKSKAGVTITQVILALVAGGLRRYLIADNDLPDHPLIAGVPMAFGPSDPLREYGNHFLNFRTDLATDVVDPWQRLLRIQANAVAAQTAFQTLDGQLVWEWIDRIPPVIARRAINSHLRSLQRDGSKADVNVNISVVRGTTTPWSLGPVPVTDLIGVGPPNGGCGVCVTAYDYLDNMAICVSTTAAAAPDPERITDAILQEMTELLSIAG